MTQAFWYHTRKHRGSRSHARLLGSLWANLHSLETALRIVLCEVDQVPDLQLRLLAMIEVPAGTSVSEDAYTTHKSFGDLVERFNSLASLEGSTRIGPSIEELRHALAHGRVTAVSEDAPIHLLNFSSEKGNRRVVRYTAAMTKEWFEARREEVRQAIHVVSTFAERQRVRVN